MGESLRVLRVLRRTSGNRRKDHALVPINTTYDLYSMGQGRASPRRRSPPPRAATTWSAPTTAGSTASPPRTEPRPAREGRHAGLHQQVARRAFLLFVTCAFCLCPRSPRWDSGRSRRSSTSQGQRRLQQASKAVAMVLFQRLQDAETGLGHVGRGVEARRDGASRPFAAVLLVGERRADRVISGEMTPPDAHCRAARHARRGQDGAVTEARRRAPCTSF